MWHWQEPTFCHFLGIVHSGKDGRKRDGHRDAEAKRWLVTENLLVLNRPCLYHTNTK